jgi:hypothetical protein
VRGQAPERASHVSTIFFWEVHEFDDDVADRCDEDGGVSSKKSRDHSFGLAMAAERHLEHILDTRRGMSMVWCWSMTLPTHSKNISERSSTGSLPEGLDEVEVDEGDKISRGDRSASGSDSERAFNLSVSMSNTFAYDSGKKLKEGKGLRRKEIRGE